MKVDMAVASLVNILCCNMILLWMYLELHIGNLLPPIGGKHMLGCLKKAHIRDESALSPPAWRRLEDNSKFLAGISSLL
jgi:hypothetical protein